MAKSIKVYTEAELRKKYRGLANKGATLIKMNDGSIRIPFRSLWLNHQTGGGSPYGKVIEIFGYESSGKTLLALELSSVTQELGGVVLWADAEQCFDFNWARLNGVEPEDVELYDSNQVEGLSDWARDMVLFYRSKLIKNEPILLVIDSLEALEVEEEIGADMKDAKASYGMLKSKKINQFYRKRIEMFKKYGITVVIINQVRQKIGATMYENAEKTPGGDATKFYAAIRISLKGGSFIRGNMKRDGFVEDKQKGKKFGRNVYSDIIKNKTAPMRQRIATEVYFIDERYEYIGYNRYAGLGDILNDLNIIKKTKEGNKNVYKYKDKVLSRVDDFCDYIHTHPKMRAKLISKAGINTVSKTREKIESFKGNVYAVKVGKSDE